MRFFHSKTSHRSSDVGRETHWSSNEASTAVFKGNCSFFIREREWHSKHRILMLGLSKDAGKRLTDVSRMNIQSKWCNVRGLLVEVMSYQGDAKTIMPFTGNSFVRIVYVLSALYWWVQECLKVWRALTQLHNEQSFQMCGCTMLLGNLGILGLRGSAYASGCIHMCVLFWVLHWECYKMQDRHQVVFFVWCCDVLSLLLCGFLSSHSMPTSGML